MNLYISLLRGINVSGRNKIKMAALRSLYMYLFCPNGYGRTKLSNAFFERKLKVPATTRNWKTVTALHDMVVT